MTTTTSEVSSISAQYDADYNSLLLDTIACFSERTNNSEPLFTTDAEGLYEAYLSIS